MNRPASLRSGGSSSSALYSSNDFGKFVFGANPFRMVGFLLRRFQNRHAFLLVKIDIQFLGPYSYLVKTTFLSHDDRGGVAPREIRRRRVDKGRIRLEHVAIPDASVSRQFDIRNHVAGETEYPGRDGSTKLGHSMLLLKEGFNVKKF